MDDPDLRSLWPAGEDCHSWKEIAPNLQMTRERLAAFLAQSDECVFMTGGCHLMAAALYSEFTRRGAKPTIFEMKLHDAFRHYLVGREDVCITDVRLKWDAPPGFELVPTGAIKTSDLARALGYQYCCTEPEFLSATKARAAAFVERNSGMLDKMAQALAHAA